LNSLVLEKIKISAVKYLNTLPFIYGLQQNGFKQQIDLSLDAPAETYEKLKNNQVHVGLVPVAYFLENPKAKVVSPFCIGSNKTVNSVLLCSNVELNKIKIIFLDHESRTSSILIQILCTKFWNINPDFIQATGESNSIIQDSEAVLIIGDRALQQRNKYKYTFDLAQIWNEYTGLPFVFACWVSNESLDEQFASKLNEALSFGVNHIEKSLSIAQINSIGQSEILTYLNENISYHLDDKKQEALTQFLKLAKEI